MSSKFKISQSPVHDCGKKSLWYSRYFCNLNSLFHCLSSTAITVAVSPEMFLRSFCKNFNALFFQFEQEVSCQAKFKFKRELKI